MPPATATTEPATNKNVQIEDAGPARKRITVTVPAGVIDDKLREAMSTLAGTTTLPGFRKGHVPQGLLEKRFGPSVRNETKNQIIASAYATIIEENQLKPVSEPEPTEEMKELELEPGKPLTFSLEVEVMPSFEMPAFESIEVKKPMLEIAEQHIDAELTRQKLLHGTPSKIEGDFQEGDRVGGYATATKEGETEPFFRANDVMLLMPGTNDSGRGSVLGLMIDGLHDMLKDKRVGDTITIDAVGPEGHEREDIRGAKMTLTLEIRAAQRVEPATPDVVAQRYGLPSEEILREQIKLALEHRRDEEQNSAMREQAVEQLAGSVEFELPEKLSAQQSARNLEQYRLELLYRGMAPEEVEEKLAEVRNDTESQARDRLKRFFLLHRLAEQFGIEVSEQEVNGRIAAIAAQRNVRPEKLRSELAQAGKLGEVARMLRDQKAADRVVQQAKKTEVNAEEWNKIYQEKLKKSGKPAGERPARRPPRKAAEAPTPKSKAPAAKPESSSKKSPKKK